MMRITVLVSGLMLGTALAAQESPIEKAATEGKNQVIVGDNFVDPQAAAPVTGSTDLIVYISGRIAEVRQLSISGDDVEYRTEQLKGVWRKERRAKSGIQSIIFGRTLQEYQLEMSQENRSPIAGTPHASTPEGRAAAVRPSPTNIVQAAAKQPVRHQEVLSGKFNAQQGRYTSWSFTFNQELNRYYTFADNATEYGTFRMRSHYVKPIGGGRSDENEVVVKGKYFLYAPGVFGNKDWVLNLSNVSYTENDIAPKSSLYTERLNDEVLIIKMSPDHNVFHLEWANQSGWQWSSPTQQTFYRVPEPEKIAGMAAAADKTAAPAGPAPASKN